MMTSSAEFNPTCQSGASWYTCNDASLFVGCCASDPCNEIGCSQGNLSPVTFNPGAYGTYPDVDCSTGVSFWSCASEATGRTFWGCCKSNPCSQEQICPLEDLVPAYLGSPVQIAWYISANLPSSSTKTAQSRPASTVKASTSTSSPTIAVTSTESTSSTTSTSRTSEIPGAITPSLQSEPNSSKPLGAIIGGAVGGTVGLLLIIVLMVWYCLHARNSRQAHNQTVSDQLSEFSPSRMTGNAWERATYVPPQYGPTHSADITPKPYPESPLAHVNQTHPQHKYDPSGSWSSPTFSGPSSANISPTVQRYSELSGETFRSELESPDRTSGIV